MPPIPAISGKEMIDALGKAGFELARIRGSHHILRHVDGRTVTVPVHSGRDMPPGTVRGILRIIGMTVHELTELL